MARRRKSFKEGDRTTFYFKKGFPDSMLDWINNQSDIQLLFEYALDCLYKEHGDKNIAVYLPRNYEIGQNTGNYPIVKNELIMGGEGKVVEPQTFKEDKPSGESKGERVTPDEEKEQPATNEEFPSLKEKDSEEDTPKNKVAWGGMSNFDDSGYM